MEQMEAGCLKALDAVLERTYGAARKAYSRAGGGAELLVAGDLWEARASSCRTSWANAAPPCKLVLLRIHLYSIRCQG